MRQFFNFILLIFIVLFVSCTTDEECRKDKYVKVQIGIYHATFNSTNNTSTVAYLNADSLTAKGIGIDSILYKKATSIHSISLPLNKFTTLSNYQIKFNTLTDTLTILHTNYDAYLSLECGCIKTHSIDTVLTTNHFIDSVKITEHDVNTTTSATENIKIYN